MLKNILYTSNPDVKVTSLEDVEAFAMENDKYFTCIAKKGSAIYDLKEGAHVLTTKGNHVYVLEVSDQEFDAKKSNITGIVSVDYPFGEPSDDFLDDLKDTLMPQEVNDVKYSINGTLCVKTSNGYVAITDNNELVRYPGGMVLDIPVFTMPKAKKDIQVGDVLSIGNSYAKVTRIAEDKITCISYKGTGRIVYPIKDFFMNESFCQVVISPMTSMGTSVNPMMLMALSGDNDNLLPLMMMGQQNINPMMLLLMNKKKKSNDSLKTLLMMQALGGQNIFAPKAEPEITE